MAKKSSKKDSSDDKDLETKTSVEDIDTTEDDASSTSKSDSSSDSKASSKKTKKSSSSSEESSSSSSDENQEMMQLELDNIVEHEGYFYRGVVKVEKNLALTLQKTDQEKTKEKLDLVRNR